MAALVWGVDPVYAIGMGCVPHLGICITSFLVADKIGMDKRVHLVWFVALAYLLSCVLLSQS